MYDSFNIDLEGFQCVYPSASQLILRIDLIFAIDSSSRWVSRCPLSFELVPYNERVVNGAADTKEAGKQRTLYHIQLTLCT